MGRSSQPPDRYLQATRGSHLVRERRSRCGIRLCGASDRHRSWRERPPSRTDSLEAALAAEWNADHGFEIDRIAIARTGNEMPGAEGPGGILIEAVVETLENFHFRHRAIGADDGIQNDNALNVL